MTITLGYTAGRYLNDESFYDKLSFFKGIGCNAIELHPRLDATNGFCISKDNLNLINTFDYISIHAPAKDFTFDDSPQSLKIYEKLTALQSALHVNLIVVHPDRIKDPIFLKNLGWPIGIENMDKFKNDGRTVDEVKTYLEKFPEAKMVLDLNHAFTNDPSLKLAKEFLITFKEKISQFHLSHYQDEAHWHEVITKDNGSQIAKLISKTTLPIIIEVDTTSLDRRILIEQFNYLSNLLS